MSDLKYDDKAWKASWYQRNKDRLKEKNRFYYLRNREKNLAWAKEYSKRPDVVQRRRQTQLETKAGSIKGLNKRPYLGYCEMCRKVHKRLFYHHWDDKRMSMGIWLCANCHWFVEGYEKGANLKTYLDLKAQLEKLY